MRSGSGGRAPRADLMKVTRRVAVGLNLVVVDGRNGRIYLFFERAQQIKSLLIAFCTGDVTIAFISNYKIITRPILEISQNLASDCIIFDNTFIGLVLACFELWFYHSNNLCLRIR